MATIDSVLIGAADPSAAERFYAAAFGPHLPVRVTASQEPTAGFRGFTLSLTVAQPADVRALVDAALDAGAVTLKPVAKSFWGFGGAVQAPDGTIWTIATSAKKDTGPATRTFESVVLLLGVDDVAATKRFYVDRGLTVAKSFGRKYAEFETGPGRVTLGLYGRRALAKTNGVDPEGSGSHRLAIVGDLGSFADPDGFGWQAASVGADQDRITS
jgi:catechol 2,3-dioxygenase-like lactoylglutathione lyase family enzyme